MDDRWLNGLAIGTVAIAAGAQEWRNGFDDPFEQATHGMPGCPESEGALLTTPCDVGRRSSMGATS